MILIDILENQIVALAVVCLIVYSFSIIMYDIWVFVVSAMIGYLVADIILTTFFIGGGSGLAQIPILGNLIQPRGHAYIAYYIGIVVATFSSAWGTSTILGMIETYLNEWVLYIRFIIGLITSILVLWDFNIRYYG